MDQIPLEVIKEKLHDRYRAQGFSENLFRNDWNLILRSGVHPQVATEEDLQAVILRAKSQGTVTRFNDQLGRHNGHLHTPSHRHHHANHLG